MEMEQSVMYDDEITELIDHSCLLTKTSIVL